jgi:hypothetical protein
VDDQREVLLEQPAEGLDPGVGQHQLARGWAEALGALMPGSTRNTSALT